MTSLSAAPVVGHDDPTVPDESIVAALRRRGEIGGGHRHPGHGRAPGLTDAFVITSGRNARQVKTIVDEVERQVKAAAGRKPVRVEGLDDARWVLMDYGDFLVHVFLDEAREFYDLEHLWADAPRVAWAVGPAA